MKKETLGDIARDCAERNLVNFWVGDVGEYEIPLEFYDVVVTKGGQPDRRYRRGKETYAYFKRKDREQAAQP